MTGSWRRPASPRCSIRCGSGARTSTDVQTCDADRGDRLGARCRPAALRSFPASALRNPDAGCDRDAASVDRARRCAADVADGSHARPAPVPRRRQTARLLPRQERQDRRRTRRAVRTAPRQSDGVCARPICARSSRWRMQHAIPLASHDDTTDENVADAIRDGVSVAEFPTTMEAARGAAPGRHRRADGRAERGARRLAFRQHRRRRSRPRRPARHPVVGLHPVEPVDGRAATAAARSGDRSRRPRSAPSPRRRRKPSASTIAARSPPASAPT